MYQNFYYDYRTQRFSQKFYLTKGKPQEHALQISCPMISPPVQLVILVKPLLSDLH